MATDKNLGPFRIRPRGEYKDNESYRFLDLVSYNGSSYLCSNYDTIDGDSCIGVIPTNTAYWMLIAEKGEVGSYEMEYMPIVKLTPNEDNKYVWNFNITDKVTIEDNPNEVANKLVINNVKNGYCGALITTKSDLVLPNNSDYSIDFNYVTITNANQYYLYTFIYAYDRFIWNRTVIERS